MQRGMDSRFLGESVGLLACRANLPGSSFATADINGNYMGVNEKFAHTRQFIQMDMDFYVDTDYRSLKFIEHWMEWIASGSTTGPEGSSPAERGYYFRMRYPNEYKCDYTKITKFDKDYKKYINFDDGKVTWEKVLFFLFSPILPLMFDMFLMPFYGFMGRYIGDNLSNFMTQYEATRTLSETVLESIPQLCLQVYMGYAVSAVCIANL